MSKFKEFWKSKLSGTNRMVPCRVCGKLTHSSVAGNMGAELCPKCLKEALEENERSDRGE